ncbi:MAG: 5-(carboxyamino)imidazole ribonucleotide synthase, partial [Gemmatimonadales bacterium]
MIEPGGTLGLLGGGQLGRMFAQRAVGMGYQIVVLEPDAGAPAAAVCHDHLVAPYDDPGALTALAARVAAVTTEFENVPAATLDWLADHVICRPASRAVAVAQDRIREKTFLRSHGLATADFEPVTTESELDQAWGRLGPPALLKTSRLGYDGKGQAMAGTLEEAREAFRRFGSVACVLERRLTLETELSVVLARGSDGEIAAFPVGENVHRRGILHTTVVPAQVPSAVAATASATAIRVAHALDYVGVLGVEMFVAAGGNIYVNEIAPRPHNSGHYTMSACVTDQFEQQVRALAELPLGSPRLLSPVCMINLLGEVWSGGTPRWEAALWLPGVSLHLYGKGEVRPGRKMGQLNCLAESPAAAVALAERAY